MKPSRSGRDPRPSFDLIAEQLVLRRDLVLSQARISIRHGRIAAIQPSAGSPRAIRGLRRADLVIPGLVNAHTHLELTGLRLRKPPAGRLDLWLEELIARMPERTPAQVESAARKGIRLCLESGTTTVGEIESAGASARVLARFPLRARIYREFLGLDPALTGERWKVVRSFLRTKVPGHLRLGVSPHSPYSLSPEAWGFLGETSARKLSGAIHFAETSMERDFLAKRRGKLWETLRRAKKFSPDHVPPDRSALRILQRFGWLRRDVALIHGNDLRTPEIAAISAAGACVIFCPGSHQFFRYETFPLRELLRAGVPVALGTDSLASNEALDLFREMRLLRRRFPRVDPAQVFQMASENGARALGWEDRVGSIAIGKDADFVLIENRKKTRGAAEIFDWITSETPPIAGVCIAGEAVL